MNRKGAKRSLSPANARNGVSKVAKLDTTATGIVQKIRLEGFMCHGVFEWTPNQNINFLIGENGSGKSSILQGLVLGLFADTKYTKRYTKIADFVQKGERSADIKITLRNEGEDAYRQEKYGPSITFHRRILQSSQSYVSILSYDKNVVVKNKEAREEGKRILDNFRINTDNPIVILQQEEAKELLKVENPTSLYEFFEKATLLKPCMEQYTEASRNLNRMKEEIATKKIHCAGKEEEKKKMVKKVVEIKKLKEKDRRETQLEKEYIIALTEKNKAERDEVMNQIKERKEKETKAKEKLSSLNEDDASLRNRKMEVEDRIESEKKKSEADDNKLNNIQLDIKFKKDEMKKTEKEKKDIQKLQDEVSGDIKILSEQLEHESTAENRRQREERKEQRAKELSELDLRTAKINQEIERRGHERDSLENALEERENKFKEIKNQKVDENQKMEALKKDLDQLFRQREEKLAVIDRFAPRVAEEIKMASSRQELKVMGPVGKYIQLKGEIGQGEEIKKLIETEIGANNLKSYLCDNDKDRKILWNILQRVYGNQKKPQIFTSKFLNKRHKVDRVEGGHNTMMDFIEISGTPEQQTVVFNYLVDQKGIEAIVIKKNQTEAEKLCTYIQNVPRNMNYCITEDFNRFFPPTRNTSYRSYFMEPTSTRILGCDMNSKMREKEDLFDASKQKVSKLEKENEKLLRLKQTTKEDIESLKTEIQKFREELGEISKQKSKLKAEEISTDNVDTLQEKMRQKQVDHENYETILKNIKTELDDTTKKLNEKNQEYNKILRDEMKKREKVIPLENDLRNIEGEISRKKKEVANQQKLINRLVSEVSQHQGKLKGLKKEGEKHLKASRQLKLSATTDIRPSGTVEEISAKLKEIKKSKKKNNLGDSDIILNEYNNLQMDIENIKKNLQLLEEWTKNIEKMHEDRLRRMLFIRHSITKIVSRKFHLLSHKFREQFGTDINIELNHKKKELRFVFRDEDGYVQKTEISSLSGGEKSYAQMCLIAALWENMNPPFRALDEWDVFLDAINRKEISRNLLEFGLTQADYQFFFISPQGAAEIEVSPADRPKVTIQEIVKS